MDCSLPGSSVHEVLQARVLEWVTVSWIPLMQHLGLGVPLPVLFLLTRMFSPCLLQQQHCHYQMPTVCRGLEQSLGFNMELSCRRPVPLTITLMPYWHAVPSNTSWSHLLKNNASSNPHS